MKEPKRPSHGLSKSLPFFARATLCEHSVERRLSLVSATLTTPPYRIPCGANWSALRTTICWRYCRFAKQICSYSSIGTDTRCCSNGAGFLFDITFCRWLQGRTHRLSSPTFQGGVLRSREGDIPPYGCVPVSSRTLREGSQNQ